MSYFFTAEIIHPDGSREKVHEECFGVGQAMAEVDAYDWLEAKYPKDGTLISVLSVTQEKDYVVQ